MLLFLWLKFTKHNNSLFSSININWIYNTKSVSKLCIHLLGTGCSVDGGGGASCEISTGGGEITASGYSSVNSGMPSPGSYIGQ